MYGRIMVAAFALAVIDCGIALAEPGNASKGEALFKQLDLNGDGFVTQDEVPQEKKRFWDRLLATSDADEDGRLSRDELAAGLKPSRPQRPLEEKQSSELPGADRVKALIAEMDADGDGTITAGEVPEKHQAVFSKLLERADRDEDGQLDRREMAYSGRILAMLTGGGGKRGAAAAMMIFQRLDANGDGKLEESEVPDQHRERFERLKQRADGNGDDVLTKEEFLQGVRAAMTGAGRPGPGPSGASPLMQSLDTDGDGELSSSEIESAASALRKLDKNEDGKITRDELGPGRRGTPQGAAAAGFILRRLKSFDQDGDGALSREEAPPRMKENFDRLDADGDGKVDDSEMKRLAEVIQERFQSGQAPEKKNTEDKSE